MDLATAKDLCKTEVSVLGMALKGFIFKKVTVTAPHDCDITCRGETKCQSFNYVIGEKSCELSARTKEARPENFQSDVLRFYMGRFSGRIPLGSIAELPALSCHEIKLSEGKDTISKMYWLDPTGTEKAELLYCDMKLDDIDECRGSNNVCDDNAYCSNTVGSYNCTCKEGFTGNGHSCSAKPCYHYYNLSDASRNTINVTISSQALCDNELLEGWYRFVGATRTKMPTTRVSPNRCGTRFSGWLNGTHPTVEDGEVYRTVCFSKIFGGCKYSNEISVKNCGSYFIYKLQQLPPDCHLRYCGTD
ncbi:uromodulin-like [Pocillopora verrucosa]|uniref:uromodulin-like n=1 Tax=Pocillopora verrucosa TaxID=203993 RepID=UPI003341EB0A